MEKRYESLFADRSWRFALITFCFVAFLFCFVVFFLLILQNGRRNTATGSSYIRSGEEGSDLWRGVMAPAPCDGTKHREESSAHNMFHTSSASEKHLHSVGAYACVRKCV